jgi:Bifunctional DNA primase/polymerase, N-terminal
MLAVAQAVLENLGARAFPIKPGQKYPPLTENGHKDASFDLSQIRAWWVKTPTANVGVACGESNFCVLDFDHIEDVPEWVKKLRTYKVGTVRGIHVYLRGARATAYMYNAEGKHIGEIKSLGGYVMAAGSIHPDGPTYTVIDDSDVTNATVELNELIDKLVKNAPMKSSADASVNGPKIPRGQHDTELHRIAGKLRHISLEEDAIYTALVEVCEKRCEDYGADYLEMCRKHAHNICKHPVPTELNFTIGGKLPEQTAAKLTQSAASTYISDTKPSEAEFAEDVIPDFDRSVITGFFKKVVDSVCEGTTIPPQFAYLAAKVFVGARMAGKVTFENLDADSSYYGAAIAETGTGKGLAWRRTAEGVFQTGNMLDSGIKLCYSADSGAGLKDVFFEGQDQPVVCYIDEVTSLGHKTGEKKNPEIMDLIIELADSNRISRVLASRKGQQANRTNNNARLSLYMCGQNGEVFMSSFAGRTKLGLYDRLYPEYSSAVEAGDLPEVDHDKAVKILIELNQMQMSGHMIMSPEAKQALEDFWKAHTPEVRKKPRFKKHLMLDMYVGAFGRGVMVAELEDLNAAIKIFERQLIIRRVCFTTEVPDKVGLYISKLKSITESMRRRLNAGETIGQVAKSVRDFQTATNAYRDNEVQTFNTAWRNWEAQVFKVSVAATNGHTYPKFIPEPNENERWT